MSSLKNSSNPSCLNTGWIPETSISLFENYSRGQVSIIEDQIRETCKRYEPRVDDVGVSVDANPDDNTLNVKVFFNIVGLESAPQSFNFILEPTR